MRVSRSAALRDTSVTKQPLGTKLGTVARAKGKRFGRPRVKIDGVRVSELRRDGLSWSQVCRALNVSKGSAQRSVARSPGRNVLVGSDV